MASWPLAALARGVEGFGEEGVALPETIPNIRPLPVPSHKHLLTYQLLFQPAAGLKMASQTLASAFGADASAPPS